MATYAQARRFNSAARDKSETYAYITNELPEDKNAKILDI
jgi:hypothetical protein